MTIKDAKNIYCLGIGGIGVSGLARLFLAMGKKVSGSDLKQTDILENLRISGAKIVIGPNPETLPEDIDLLIYTPAIPKEDLARFSVPKLSHGEAIGELMEDKYGIGVTGTNGKSTTTAMLGLILKDAGLDPTVLIGSLLKGSNAWLGQSKYVVAESDEYDRKMLQNKPKMIVVTNIAEDHLDVYKDLNDIKEAFLQYVQSLPADGILIYNADDHNTVEVCKHATCHKFTFGIHHYADLQAINRVEGGGVRGEHFDLHYDDQMTGTFELQVPGLFNVSNALGAALAAMKLGVSIEIIKNTLANFGGLWRRFEIVGNIHGKPVISDYAHHPAGIIGTIQAAKEFYPGKKVLVVFQPHHHNRTKSLFKEFVEALLAADEVIVPEIFDVAGREHGEDISSADLVAELKKEKENATFAKDLNETENLIKEKLPNFDVVLMMGAGDIDDLARKMVK